ncbi:unnamed protein product [Closterium sp. Naga37s-1]|nr:unnamed protein product [Closterium sp. Naga37s-1]
MLGSSTSAAGTLSREGDGSSPQQADFPLPSGGNKLPFSSRISPPLPRRPAATHRLRRLRKRTANGTFYLSDELADITEVWSSSILLRPPVESNGGGATSGNSPPSSPPSPSPASSTSGNIEAPISLGEEELGEVPVVSESGSGVATSSVVSELVARVAREPIETIESLDLSRVLEAEVGPDGVLTEGVASAVLVELSRAGKSRHALKLFDWLKARAFLLSTSAHTALIAALARSGPYADAARVLAGMRAAGLSPTVHACTAAMQAQSRAGRWRAALLLLEEMRGMGLKPDTMAYNAVLTACGRAGRVQEVLAVYQAMQDDECRPSTGTRALLMSTFVRADRCDLALQLFFDARLAGQPVTPDMHRGLICVASKVGRWPLALDLLDDLLATWTDPGAAVEPAAGVAVELAAGVAASATSRMESGPPAPDGSFEARQDEGSAAATVATAAAIVATAAGDAAGDAAGGGRRRSSDAGSGERWEGGNTWGEVLGAPNSALPFNALISSLARAGKSVLYMSVQVRPMAGRSFSLLPHEEAGNSSGPLHVVRASFGAGSGRRIRPSHGIIRAHGGEGGAGADTGGV